MRPPTLIKNAGGAESLGGKQSPLGLLVVVYSFSAFLALFLRPSSQVAIQDEGIRFIEYLMRNGFVSGDAVLTSAE
jgi:hypothetical protein